MENSDVNININTKSGDGKGQALLSLTKRIGEANWKTIFKVYGVMFAFFATAIIMVFCFTAVRDRRIVSDTAQRILLKDSSDENIRDFVVTPKIQHELEKLVYILKADRAFLFEMHNGKKNSSGLPFRFADMSYEEVNDEKTTDKVAMQFQNIPLTLYKYPHYLQKEKMIIGDLEQISEIDPDFADHIRNVGGVYLGMTYINNNGLPLGFLCVSYHDMADVPNKEVIETKLKEYAKLIGNLLDLQVQVRD